MKEMNDMKSLLYESAPIMSRLASKYCKQSVLGDRYMQSENNNPDCEWYHAAWQYCKLTEISPIINYHQEQFSSFFRRYLKRESIDILVSGTADYAILSDLIESAPCDILEKVKITVLDICRTPIEICKWYINKLNTMGISSPNVSYIVSDALHTNISPASFDLITTYFFISRFQREDRIDLINEWKRLLKDKGEIIITDLILSEENSNVDKAKQVAFFENRVKTKVNSLNVSSEQTIDILDKLMTYGINSIDHPTYSEEYFESLFSDFLILETTMRNMPGEMEDTVDIITYSLQKK